MSGDQKEGDKVAKVAWKEGFFKMGETRAMILQTSGNKLLMQNLVALDYPEIEAISMSFDCFSGNFGKARWVTFEFGGLCLIFF